MSANAVAKNIGAKNGAQIGQLVTRVVTLARALPVSVWQKLLVGAAALWLCHSLASLFWVAVGEPELEQPKVLAVPVGGVKQTAGKPINLTSLQELKLFGDGSAVVEEIPTTEPTPVTEEIDTTKTTKLSLKLQGTMVSSTADQSSAIIEAGSEQAYYRVGDEIKKNRGVKLVKVMDQRVILDNKGSLEALWLYSEEDFKSIKNASPGRQPEKKQAKKVADENRVVAKARPDQIPKSVGDVVRFSVHREEGKMIGYRIRPGRDKALFEQLGLKTNDIVTSVNGIEVNDPKKIRSVYKEVKSAPEAELTVLRDGQTFSINITVDAGG